MEWNEILFKFIILILTVLGGVITYYIIPFIKSKTTLDQRKNLIFYTQLAIKLAESIYKEKGQGKFKKEYVITWLKKQGINFTEEQINTLIDSVVQYLNTQGWDKELLK